MNRLDLSICLSVCLPACLSACLPICYVWPWFLLDSTRCCIPTPAFFLLILLFSVPYLALIVLRLPYTVVSSYPLVIVFWLSCGYLVIVIVIVLSLPVWLSLPSSLPLPLSSPYSHCHCDCHCLLFSLSCFQLCLTFTIFKAPNRRPVLMHRMSTTAQLSSSTKETSFTCLSCLI
jgi:hypothetical protein